MNVVDWVSILSDITITITAIIFPFLFRYYDKQSRKLQVIQELMQSWDRMSAQIEHLNLLLYHKSDKTPIQMLERCVASCDLKTGAPLQTETNNAKRTVNTFLRTVESYVSVKQYSYNILTPKDLYPIYDMIFLALRVVEPFNWVWHQINIYDPKEPILRPECHVTLSKILKDLNPEYYEKKSNIYTSFLGIVLADPNIYKLANSYHETLFS